MKAREYERLPSGAFATNDKEDASMSVFYIKQLFLEQPVVLIQVRATDNCSRGSTGGPTEPRY
jgi:hypothetical protein